jgi:tripartite-type tricarboxylate transporter receptor subunit TctC
MTFNRRAVIGSIAAAALAPVVRAQSKYPDKPIKLIVPFPAGGQTDAAARMLAERVGASMGQPIVVENRAGASSLVGTEVVIKSPPDGYTLLLNMTAVVTNAILLPQANYDVFRDLAPVTRLYELTGIWAVPGNGPKTLAEFIQKAKSSPNPLSFATTGHASSSHYFGEILARTGGFKLTHAPYKGEAPIIPDLLEGRVDAAVISGQTVMQFGKDGRIRPLATTGATRIKALPEIPTFEEQGVTGLTLESFCGIFAPAGTPQPIVDRLNEEFNKAIQQPDLRERITAFGVNVAPAATPAAFTAIMRKAHGEWVDIKKRSVIRFEGT